MTQSSLADEKVILEQKRKELHALEMTVFKVVIAIERINYYTMGVILPRDHNLNLIPFFEGANKDPNSPLYDFQSCLQICSLVKNMIERQEQIERQLTPYASGGGNLYRASTITQPIEKKSYYFSRSNPAEMKEKADFRVAFDS